MKKDKVEEILQQIKEQTDELLEDEAAEEMSAEEIVVLATELTTYMPVTMVDYTFPVGIVDKERVIFYIDEHHQIPWFGELYYGED